MRRALSEADRAHLMAMRHDHGARLREIARHARLQAARDLPHDTDERRARFADLAERAERKAAEWEAAHARPAA